MSIVEIRNLNKTYPSFALRDVSFDIEEGKITGFVGRNGAGKTTTIKSMLNLVHPDSGEIRYFGKPLTGKGSKATGKASKATGKSSDGQQAGDQSRTGSASQSGSAGNEDDIKQLIGYSTGAVSWYPRKKIKDIVAVTKGFYDSWDEAAYRKYLAMFNIDENKTARELSEGMKVKCNLLMALSHKAKVLILDEPTSGLDPFSRDELLEVFKQLKEGGVAIFFSTHIVSDLEKCADNMVYISNGRIISACAKADFTAKHALEGESLEETILRMEREGAGRQSGTATHQSTAADQNNTERSKGND